MFLHSVPTFFGIRVVKQKRNINLINEKKVDINLDMIYYSFNSSLSYSRKTMKSHFC